MHRTKIKYKKTKLKYVNKINKINKINKPIS